LRIQIAPVINFVKPGGEDGIYHSTGVDHTKGDILNRLDWSATEVCDLKVTTDLVYNVTKYFNVDPNCWFDEDVIYTAVDSPNDEDTDVDSIKATVSIKTSIPHDKIRIKGKLKKWPSGDIVLTKIKDNIITSDGLDTTFTVTIPPTAPPSDAGNYFLYLELYNSTGMVNDTVKKSGTYYNDTDTQSGYFSLNPRGNRTPSKPNDIQGNTTVKVGKKHKFNTSTTDPNGDQLQYQWAWRYDRVLRCRQDRRKVGPYESGELCSTPHTYWRRGRKTISVRARDYFGKDWSQCIWDKYGDWGDWSDPFYVKAKWIAGFGMSCTALSSPPISMWC
jgi:hypothetical protein